jgi:hypothetical protein
VVYPAAYITILVELGHLLGGRALPPWLFHLVLVLLLVPAALAPADPAYLVPVSRASVGIYAALCALALGGALASPWVDPAAVPCAPSAQGLAQRAPPWPLVQASAPAALRALPILCQAYVCQGYTYTHRAILFL